MINSCDILMALMEVFKKAGKAMIDYFMIRFREIGTSKRIEWHK
jgi:hypothetical protein